MSSLTSTPIRGRLSAKSFTSPPAQNALPAPVTTTQRTLGSSSTSSAAWKSSRPSPRVSALNASGRLSVIVATPSRRSRIRDSKFIVGTSVQVRQTRRRATCATTSRISWILSGFTSTRSTPCSRRSSGESSTPKPVTRMTGTAGAISLIARATCHPDARGIARSVKTTSNGSAPKRAIASLPSLTTTARWPPVSSTSRSIAPTVGSSSTTRQRSETSPADAGAAGAPREGGKIVAHLERHAAAHGLIAPPRLRDLERLTHHLVQVDGDERLVAPDPCELLEAPDRLGAVEGRALDHLEPLAELRVLDPLQNELGAPEDRGEQVVEVVGDARRHLAEGAELLGAHELVLGGGQLAVRASALFEEPRATERERGEVRDVGQKPLVALGEGALPAAERQHAQDAVARDHRPAEPAPELGGGPDGLDAVPCALGRVVVGPDRAPRFAHDRHQPRRALGVAERGLHGEIGRAHV